MRDIQYIKISGKENGDRLETRVLEERVQKAVAEGHRNIEVEAYGQHGIGGRLWSAGDEPVNIKISGSSGQRTGSFGFPNTNIEIMGPASDDIGWLNAGAEITVHGNATNGTCNAMAQGKVFIKGNIGARGMTMTKRNPRFEPPELWVLGSAGDYFGEFMAGGIAVICGFDPQDPDNILGYRPLVGMVGGSVFFRGPHKGYSTNDAKLIKINNEQWDWLTCNLKDYLSKICRDDLFDKIAKRDEWQLLTAFTPQEKHATLNQTMSDFRTGVWDRELGKGGIIGDLSDLDMSHIEVIPTGDLRRYVPVWENKKYLAPCHATCPSGIPVAERWGLVRNGDIDDAVELALGYTPFPATVCGYLCPNLCMDACTRQSALMPAIDVKQLGKASIEAKTPELPESSGKKIAVIGGGPAGISVAWQLRMAGHEATIYDSGDRLGGKIARVIPESRIPEDVLTAELDRINDVVNHEKLAADLTRNDVEKLLTENEYLVVATGAQQPRILDVPGKERLITGLEFLQNAKKDKAIVGKTVVIIGAGNSACDAATEAKRLGAEDITLIDVQEPAAFGEEKVAAEEAGAKFKWPCFTKEITGEAVVLDNGEILKADTVIISIGDVPSLGFLPTSVDVAGGVVVVDENGRTSDPKIFAIGDITGLGLITDVIGAGRRASDTIIALLKDEKPAFVIKEVIDTKRIKLEYFSPRVNSFKDIVHCGDDCASCGNCRDCGICVAVCPQTAISRMGDAATKRTFEYVVDGDKCIGCGFCADACPCGIWNLVKNSPIG